MVALRTPNPNTVGRPAGVFSYEDIRGDTQLDCDVVIVGSGAGGATMGAELAEAGFDVVIVEEGHYRQTSEFNANSGEMVRKLYRDGGATMAIGSPTVLYQEGRTVGGSTVINGAMSWRTPDAILQRWHREHGIDRILPGDMERFFDRVERRIHVAYQDPGTVGRDNELLKIGAEKKNWNIVDNRRNQLHCAGSNNCAFGCPTGAKQSALVTYIPRALHFGARIYSNVRVDKILTKGKRAIGVTGRVVSPNGQKRTNFTVRAKLVISACGAIHTPALLSRSGIASPSGRIGKNLSLHPNCKLIALFDDKVRGWEGVHQAYQVREFEDQGFLFAAVNLPPSILAMSSHLHGNALGRLLDQYQNMVVAGMLVEDTNTGRILTDPTGAPRAFYQLSDFDADKLIRGVALLCELLFEAGARRILLPFAGIGDLTGPDDIRKLFKNPIDKRTIEVVTVHLMGTAAMGSDRSRAVTDMYGHVYDADRLVIADASLFPTPIGVNPAETIQALATRSAEYLIENSRRFMQ